MNYLPLNIICTLVVVGDAQSSIVLVGVQFVVYWGVYCISICIRMQRLDVCTVVL